MVAISAELARNDTASTSAPLTSPNSSHGNQPAKLTSDTGSGSRVSFAASSGSAVRNTPSPSVETVDADQSRWNGEPMRMPGLSSASPRQLLASICEHIGQSAALGTGSAVSRRVRGPACGSARGLGLVLDDPAHRPVGQRERVVEAL